MSLLQMGGPVFPPQRLHTCVHHGAGSSRQTQQQVQRTQREDDRLVYRHRGGSSWLEQGAVRLTNT